MIVERFDSHHSAHVHIACFQNELQLLEAARHGRTSEVFDLLVEGARVDFYYHRRIVRLLIFCNIFGMLHSEKHFFFTSAHALMIFHPPLRSLFQCSRRLEERTPKGMAAAGDMQHAVDSFYATHSGKTPLLWASHGGHTECVRLLLEHGASVRFEDEVCFGACCLYYLSRLSRE